MIHIGKRKDTVYRFVEGRNELCRKRYTIHMLNNDRLEFPPRQFCRWRNLRRSGSLISFIHQFPPVFHSLQCCCLGKTKPARRTRKETSTCRPVPVDLARWQGKRQKKTIITQCISFVVEWGLMRDDIAGGRYSLRTPGQSNLNARSPLIPVGSSFATSRPDHTASTREKKAKQMPCWLSLSD